MLKALFSSKKFIAALASMVVAVLGSLGLDLDTETLMAILSPMMAYIIGQGVADHGKEKAKVEASKT